MMKKTLLFICLALLVVAGGTVFAQTEQTDQTGQEKQTTEKTEAAQPAKAVKAEKKTETAQDDELKLGRIYFPRAFVHAGKNYNRGIYRMILTEKEGQPWFKVFSKKNEPLFEELAVVKPYKGKRKRFKHRVRKEMLRGYEYFRVKVIKPDNEAIAYFFVKKESEAPAPGEKTGAKTTAQKERQRITN
ncbi:MAG: hypothetical protein GY950_18175 [bacterium]|nr:hypothetical protein [bacterium]